MKWLCKIFGHKYTDWHSGITRGNELYVHRVCERCGKAQGKWLPL